MLSHITESFGKMSLNGRWMGVFIGFVYISFSEKRFSFEFNGVQMYEIISSVYLYYRKSL